MARPSIAELLLLRCKCSGPASQSGLVVAMLLGTILGGDAILHFAINQERLQSRPLFFWSQLQLLFFQGLGKSFKVLETEIDRLKMLLDFFLVEVRLPGQIAMTTNQEHDLIEVMDEFPKGIWFRWVVAHADLFFSQ